ncbi:hypothetical protein SDRG_11379 [Saprolegnia diclina VS20]|uniref:BRO1 domain-containing protein n=1 Tax=Saprolegnia diclina (strain VS20) TaxID=1156394 RepID=T0RF41_SAPDV|nr:hypothetical protein SDRG_11379 [Saprolegnia diclina VS20]EQC30898.1 hypothetical protein SDRG_11379 [Saprolegnia diclina VS20]|eukprot:XP_008615636.1 hypothetical protein SDRG_11379 [Saprolegnia diclina VS20]
MHCKYCLATFLSVTTIVIACQQSDVSTLKVFGGVACVAVLYGVVSCNPRPPPPPKPRTIRRDDAAKLLKLLPGHVAANALTLTESKNREIAALHELRRGLVIYDHYLDDAATPATFFTNIRGFIDRFVFYCPRNGTALLGAITTQSLDARDGYEKASREVYFWCVAALPLLDSFVDALQQEHTGDAQTLLLSVYEHGATIMRTVASALANTESHLTDAKANVMALRACLMPARCEYSLESAPEIKLLTGSDANSSYAPMQFSDLEALVEAKKPVPALEASPTLATTLLELAHRIELMTQSIRSGWKQLEQTNVINEIESEMRQHKLLQLLDDATKEAYITSAKHLRTACDEFMQRHLEFHSP